MNNVEKNAWYGMLSRCHNPSNAGYRNYGGRGIAVCAEWRHSFDAFFAHIGPRPGHGYSVDRINNDGNYEPGNVRWATRVEQERNKRRRPVADSQRAFLSHLMREIRRRGYSPTMRDLAAQLRITRTAIALRLKSLVRRGYVTVSAGTARSVVVTPLGKAEASAGHAILCPPVRVQGGLYFAVERDPAAGGGL